MGRKTRFRPCIDLHQGKVKQIVGGTLDSSSESLEVNFTSDQTAGWFAKLYADDQLTGGHIIKLGPGNDEAAREALAAFPGGLQIGGGITCDNATEWLDAGASQVIVTSHLFDETDFRFRQDRLEALSHLVGPERLVIDLSCRSKEDGGWIVAMNRWQSLTDLEVSMATLDSFAPMCSEFLIHAADVEGKCEGIDESLVQFLGNWGQKPVTYAGGATSTEDLERVNQLSGGTVDLTIGSALDIFGGNGAAYRDCVRYNQIS